MGSFERDRDKISRRARNAGVLIAEAIVAERGAPPWETTVVEELKTRISAAALAIVPRLPTTAGAPLETIREFVERHALNAAAERLLVLSERDDE